ncbi:MAG: hypothetical protein ACOX54_03025 [Christensenellales bacterium]|jgi:hypothetical protein
MARENYELLALFMRYWFVFLMLVISIRAVRLMAKERHEYKKLIDSLPDAGLIGEIVDITTGNSYPLPREGDISNKAGADIRLIYLPRSLSIHFEFVPRKGIRLSPVKRNTTALMDGIPLYERPYALHGSYIQAGSYTLRVRLFEGVDVPYSKRLSTSMDDSEGWSERTWDFAADDYLYHMQTDVNYESDYDYNYYSHQEYDYGYEDEEGYTKGFDLAPPSGVAKKEDDYEEE